MQNNLNTVLNGQAAQFLQSIRTDKSHYARDQFKLIQTMYDKYGLEAVLKAIEFCQSGRLFSANYVKDYLEHESSTSSTPSNVLIPVSNRKYHVTTEKRPLEVYAKVGAGK